MVEYKWLKCLGWIWHDRDRKRFWKESLTRENEIVQKPCYGGCTRPCALVAQTVSVVHTWGERPYAPVARLCVPSV